MIAHDKFVFGYENDSLECSVSVLLTLRLSLTGRIRERKVSINLFLWSLGFALLIALSVIEFLQLPFIWALLCAAITLAFLCIGGFFTRSERLSYRLRWPTRFLQGRYGGARAMDLL